MSLIEFEKWFLDRMYGEHKMSAEIYDEISDKIISIKNLERPNNKMDDSESIKITSKKANI